MTLTELLVIPFTRIGFICLREKQDNGGACRTWPFSCEFLLIWATLHFNGTPLTVFVEYIRVVILTEGIDDVFVVMDDDDDDISEFVDIGLTINKDEFTLDDVAM